MHIRTRSISLDGVLGVTDKER